MARKIDPLVCNSFSGIDISVVGKGSKELSSFEKFVFPMIRTISPPILPVFRLGKVWLRWKDG